MVIGMNIRLNLIVTKQALQVRLMVRSFHHYLSVFNIIVVFFIAYLTFKKFIVKAGTINCRAIQNMPSFYLKKMHLNFL